MSDWENDIVIQISEAGAKNTEAALKSISREYQKLQNLAKHPLSPLGGAGAAADSNFAKSFSPQEFNKATSALSQFGIEYEKVSKNVRSPLSGGDKNFADAFTKAGSGLDKVAESGKRATTSLTGAAQAIRIFRTLVFASGAEKFAMSIIHGADELTNLQNKLKVVAKEGENMGFTMSRITDIANRNRSSLEAVATVYSRTARSVESLGVSQAATLEFTKVLTQAVAVGGSTSIESSQAMIQLSQGLASGALKGDELRSVLEQLPVVSKLIAKELGVTVGELRKLGAEGKILAEDVFVALINAADDMEVAFAKMTPTFEQSAEVLRNNWINGLQMFQPLVRATGEALGSLTEAWTTFGDAMEEAFKIWIRHRDDGFFSRVGAVFTEQVGKPGESMSDVLKRKQQDRQREREDEDAIQKGQAMEDAYDLVYGSKRPKHPPTTHKEGGLTFEELLMKSRQENEVAGQDPFNQGVTKEFFQKMGELKKSIREAMIAGAGKGGKADEQLRLLHDMIEAEHEKASANRVQLQLEQELYELEQEQIQKSIDLGKQEQETRSKNILQVQAQDRAITASLDPFREYNDQVVKYQDYIHRHPEDAEKVTKAVEKLGTAYQTFAPIFSSISDNIADAAANALVFGDNMADSLQKIGKAFAQQAISSLFKIGIGALFGTPMAGLNGGTQLAGASPGANTSFGGPVTFSGGNYNPGAAGGAGGAFASGGYTGAGHGRGDIAGTVHGQEFVVNANATARNRAMLESMNAGKPVGSSGNVVIHNYAGAAVTANTNDRGEIEVMVRQAIADQAPGVIATDLHNPSSKTAKALKQRYEVQRRN